METLGDADEVGDEDLPEPGSPWTPEAVVITAAGLVLASMVSSGLFQFLAFYVDPEDVGARPRALIYVGPGAALAALGALLGWRSKTQPLGPALHGLAMASAVIGATIAVASAAGIVMVWMAAPERF